MERGTKRNQPWISKNVEQQTMSYFVRIYVLIKDNTSIPKAIFNATTVSAEPIVNNIKTLPRSTLSFYRRKAGHWMSRERRSLLLSNVGTGRHLHNWRRHDLLQHWACARLQSLPVRTSDISIRFCYVCSDIIFLHHFPDTQWPASHRLEQAK